MGGNCWSNFEYDAIYQLLKASGREHAGLGGNAQRNNSDVPFQAQLPHANDTNAVKQYTELFEYDDCGNIKQLRHIATDANWTQLYSYEYQDDANNNTNRLKSTSLPGDADAGPYSATYQYDIHGNMTKMPHLNEMVWNFMDQLTQVNLGGGGMAFYVFGIGGARIRKVIERLGGKKTERIYLGAVEIYREYQNNTKKIERSTLHISDNTGRIAQVDTKLFDEDNTDIANPLNTDLIRYQYTNHLGSATMETDEVGVVISYEEYHPYGTSAYRSSKSNVDLSLKRYRFSGKERDDETGLYYFGARFYAAWLGRWTSSDPAGFVDGLNLFSYCRNNPVMFHDPNGMGVNWDIPDWAYTGTETQFLERINITEVTGTVTEGQDEGRRIAVRATVTSAERVTDAEGREFWQATEYTINELRFIAEGEEGDGGTSTDAPEPAAEQPSPEPTPEPAPEPAPSASESAGSQPSEPEPPEAIPNPRIARYILEELARPQSVTGARPRGTLHLWSRPAGKASARAAIQSSGSGWMMGDIEGAPTPQHVAGEQEFARARARAPGGRLTQAEFERIWGPRSASVVGRGAFAGHPVQAHGTPAPTSIQVRYEWPARAVGGGIRGPFVFGTGMFTAITGAQDPNAAVAIPLTILGVGEATSGIICGSGAILASAEAMAIGTAGATFFGGVAAAVGFGVASARSFERGDTAGGVVNALGAVGGVLLVASLFTPVGWVGLVGLGLVALAGGFNLGGWLSD